jgi:hypothetical protein
VADEFDFSAEADAADLQAFRDKMAAARAVDDQNRFQQTLEAAKGQEAAPATGGGSSPATRVQGAVEAVMDTPIGKFGKALEGTIEWVRKLPKNMSLGLLDAAKNSVDTLNDVANSDTGSQMTHLLAGVDPAEFPDLEVTISPFNTHYQQWRESLRDDASMSDNLTQGVAQFVVPFTGYSKALGASRNAGFLNNVLTLGAAEAVTSATVLAPQDGRTADLIELGRESEGRFGEVLRTLTPDGSLQNQYIEWMTDRENETALEGRFKNTVDGLGVSAALGGMLKTAGMTFRGARTLIEKAAELPVPAPKSEVKVAPGGFRETHSGLVFKDEKDAADAVEVLAHQFGSGFEQRAAANWAKASDKNFATLHSFAQVLKANADKPVATASLVEALEKNIKGDTETGAFYKELLGRLKAKNLGGMTTATAEAGPKATSKGGYMPKSNAVKLYPNAFAEGPEALLHTFTHEAVHAATVREIRASAEVSGKVSRLYKKILVQFEAAAEEAHAARAKAAASEDDVAFGEAVAKDLAAKKKPYGFTDPEEFVAEIESDPEFRKRMKETLIDGESAWDRYKKAIGGILGITGLVMNPEFDKLMDPEVEEEEGA